MKYKLFIFTLGLFAFFLAPALAATVEPPLSAQLNVPANLRRVELSWQASPTPGALYRIYRSQASDVTGDIVADRLPVLNYVDTTVNYGATYYYRLAAILDTAVSTLTAPLSAAPNLAPPGNVAATDTAAGGEIKVTWERPTQGLVLTYNIFRSTSDTSLGELIAREFNGVEYLNTGLDNGTRYYYRLKAVDITGHEGAVSQLAIGVASDQKAPLAPVAAGNFESPDRAYLTWTTPPNERGLVYVIYRSPSPGLTGDRLTQTSENGYRQYSLPIGATYYYSVMAVDGGGNISAASNQVKITINPATTVTSTPKVSNLTADGTTVSGEVLLGWRLPGDNNLAYSRVYRSTSANGEPAQIADRVVGSSYLDKTAKAGERYYYTIRLVNKDGVEYQPSDQVSATAFDPADRSQGAAASAPGVKSPPAKTTPAKSTLLATPRAYAYGKKRMANLRLETALANNLRKFLGDKLGKRPVPRILSPVLIKAYLYGGYSVDEIAHTITNGPGRVHPTIPAVVWRKSSEYQQHR